MAVVPMQLQPKYSVEALRLTMEHGLEVLRRIMINGLFRLMIHNGVIRICSLTSERSRPISTPTLALNNMDLKASFTQLRSLPVTRKENTLCETRSVAHGLSLASKPSQMRIVDLQSDFQNWSRIGEMENVSQLTHMI